jgi:hypothetical protein
VVEKKNRTLCEMAQTMLDEHRTLRRFWDEAINITCYVSNRIYLRVYKKKTCYELMHGRTPKVSHFHVFGCKCFNLKKVKKLDKLHQMDVNSAFLNSVLEEEVYVRQPPGFESEKYSHQVYKLRKALYGLKQAPRAWYGRLGVFLFQRGFEMGKVDQTLFLLRHGRDILVVQVYVDDIVFGGSSKSLVARFAEDMSREFEMSMMGEL